MTESYNIMLNQEKPGIEYKAMKALETSDQWNHQGVLAREEFGCYGVRLLLS